MRFERDVVLNGAEAAAWMRGHGWRVIGSSDELHLTADSAQSPEFILKRLWHTAAVTATEPYEDCAGFKFVSFLLEGSVTLVTSSGAQRVSAPSHLSLTRACLCRWRRLNHTRGSSSGFRSPSTTGCRMS